MWSESDVAPPNSRVKPDVASPALQRTLAFLWQRKAAPGYDRRDLAERRAELAGFDDLYPVPADVAVEPVDQAGVRGVWLRPDGADPEACLLYLHGGGYTRGSARSHQGLVARLASAANVEALVLEYRLAPEHPCPAAIEDAGAAIDLLVDRRGFDPCRLVVGGDSAGGGLAVATLVQRRDAGAELPAGLVVLSPWVDLRPLSSGARLMAALDPVLSEEDLLISSAAYRGVLPDDDPRVSPILADLRGLPPMLVLVGDRELLRDDSVTLARVATDAGVTVELVVEPGLFHVWPLFPELPESALTVRAIGSFIRSRTAPSR